MLNDFVWPSKGDEQVFDSLSFHAKRHADVKRRLDAPNRKEKMFVLHSLEEIFSRPISNYWRKKVVLPTWAWFQEALKEVDRDSSPGWPWKASYRDNREFLYVGEEPHYENWRLLYSAFLARLLELNVGPSADDLNVFIKDELHKIQKRRDGAWRLISAVSLTDCMVDRWLFGDFFNSLYERDGWECSPNKAGWAPVKGGFKWFYERLKAENRKVYMADKSSWDWTMQKWVVEVVTELLVRVCARRSDKIARLIRNRLMSVFRTAIFNVGGHTRIQQALWGIMKSGWLGTIVVNGFAQVCLDLLAKLRLELTGLAPPDVLGDDTVQICPYKETEFGLEYLPETYTRYLQNAGCIVKDYNIIDPRKGEKVEFAGTLFNNEVAVPAYRKKHLAVLMTLKDTKKEALDSYLRLYAFDDYMFPRLFDWTLHAGYDAVSRDYGIDWYRGQVLTTEDYWRHVKLVDNVG